MVDRVLCGVGGNAEGVMMDLVRLPTYPLESRRLGRFSIAADFLRQYNSDVLRVMGKCIVFRAEYQLDTDRIEYVAISDHFDEVPVGSVAPGYLWFFHSDGYMWCERQAPF